jgi:hypothetical protein
MKKIITITICLTLFFQLSPLVVYANDDNFNPNFIISDSEMQDYGALSIGEIASFLKEKGSSLYNMYFPDYQGRKKSAAVIIYQAALEHHISPKFLLTVLQKEQSLIENPNPSQRDYDWATGYGVCDSCSTTDPDIQDFKGFGKQVDYAARINRKYYNFPEQYGFQVGKSVNVDGIDVMPANQATANLYNYTPHIAGNLNFWKLWSRYWAQSYPDGSLIRDENGDIWYIQFGRRRKVTSMSVLYSRFDPNKIISVTNTDIAKYEEGLPIKFANYSLLRIPSGRIYLLVDDELRYITSPEVFRIIGYNLEEVIEVSEKDLQGYEAGPAITVDSIYPVGALLQDERAGGVYYVENGVKHPIYSRELMLANFKNRVLTQVSLEELAKYETGEPVKFRDGELIKAVGNPTVYVISDGKRRPIASGKVFEKLGYKWDNIIETSSRAVYVHELGEAIQ